MSSYPPNPASRRPEGSWPPPDEDFRVLPPPGVSQPAVSQPVSTPITPPVQNIPAPQPVVVVPQPARNPPAPRPQTSPANRQRILLGVVVALILFAAIAFYLFFQVFNNNNLIVTQATASPRSTASTAVAVTAGPALSSLSGAETAIAAQAWPTAGPACDSLLNTSATEASVKTRIATSLTACATHFIDPGSPDVPRALQYYQAADKLTPNKQEIRDEIALAQRYLTAKNTLNKPDLGGFIDQLEWYTLQPQFANKPYADTMQLLYNAYVDSGKGADCGNAVKRFKQALTVPFVEDKTEANNQLAVRLKECG